MLSRFHASALCLWRASVVLVAWIVPAASQNGLLAADRIDAITDDLKKLQTIAESQQERDALASQLPEATRRARSAMNAASSNEWATVKSWDEWSTLRDKKLARLVENLGQPQSPPAQVNFKVTRRKEYAESGFVIENVIYESRPQLWVSANLYRPIQPRQSAPGILISHAHHTPKEHGELQDMGMIWARAGCYVLVPDHFGHGERRQHPFASADSFPRPFRIGRQDYYFRYDLGIKLHLLGESLMSWLAWDLSRGVDLLLEQPGIDRERIILLGAVAGGGDPCAVTAALDRRIAAAVPFNFGGPQPETQYPLPADAETSFNYAGSGSWESTRNLTRSASDGFLPWMIVGSIAPRRLVYAHEFAWDQVRDPVWKRLQAIYHMHGAADHLAFTHGRGGLSGQPPEATHCTHIGPFHRARIHQAFKQWFQIDVSPADESFSQPVSAESLRCFPENSKPGEAQPLFDFGLLAEQRLSEARTALQASGPGGRRAALQASWKRLLGRVEMDPGSPSAEIESRNLQELDEVRAERVLLRTDPGIRVPLVFLRPPKIDLDQRLPTVVMVSHLGKQNLLDRNAAEIAKLLNAGSAVCIADLRGTGESQRDPARGRSSASTSLSSSLLMLGDPLVAGQLRDARAVVQWLRTRSDVDGQQMSIWGESRSATATADQPRVAPRDDDAALPPSVEPAGCVTALLLVLFEDSMQSICLSGGLTGFASAVQPAQVRIPHDCVVPGLLTAGDIEELVAEAAERMPVRIDGLVDGANIALSAQEVDQYLERIERMYRTASSGRLPGGHLSNGQLSNVSAGDWLAQNDR